MRPNKLDYYLEIAEVVGKRSSCIHEECGAIIVRGSGNGSIVSTGYKGAPMYRHHCEELDQCSVETHLHDIQMCRAVPAEVNAIMSCSPEERYNSIMYISRKIYREDGTFYYQPPSGFCKRILLNSGIRAVAFRNEKGDPEFKDVSRFINDDETLVEESL